jgi:hypothetical protein
MLETNGSFPFFFFLFVGTFFLSPFNGRIVLGYNIQSRMSISSKRTGKDNKSFVESFEKTVIKFQVHVLRFQKIKLKLHYTPGGLNKVSN